MTTTHLSKLEKILFQLTIFLIPSNLAYHFISKASFINGVLVDYLIPKLYLSDIPILILLFLWLIRSLKAKNKITLSFSSVLFLILLPIGILSDEPLASIWFWFKLLELSLFFLWIKTHIVKGDSLRKLYRLIYKPLIISLLIQSLVGIYQVAFQKSLAGYWFFGETALNISSQIDKIHLRNYFPGLKTSLLMPAYGTTPHNNVLAGFLSIGIILLYLSSREITKKQIYQKVTLYITYTLSLITLLLTFSGSAWISLIIAISLIGLSHASSKLRTKLITKILLSLVTIIIIYITIIPLNTANPSIVRRQQLNQISLHMFKDHPLKGVGLNNFTSLMKNYQSISSNTQFLQPPHNIFLLWISETGLLGIILLLLIIRKEFSHFSIHHLQTLSLLMILLISLLDHYPLTLQTGQLLAIFSLSLVKINKI
jgi:O-antigen ligase